jgi:hypothetical protein
MDYLAITGYYLLRIIKDRLCWCFRANKLPAASGGEFYLMRLNDVGAHLAFNKQLYFFTKTELV